MLRSKLPRDSRDEGGECASGELSGSFFIRSPPYASKNLGVWGGAPSRHVNDDTIFAFIHAHGAKRQRKVTTHPANRLKYRSKLKHV